MSLSESTPPSDFSVCPSELTQKEFVCLFGDLYEHSPWVASRTWERGLTADHNEISQLADAFADTLAMASRELKIKLILAHPDLAGRAAVAGSLTADSSDEQQSAGIDNCSQEEFKQFQQYNTQYKDKFNFPFIMAVRGSNTEKILAAFEQRLHNDEQFEFETALQEINKIAQLRLQAMSKNNSCIY